MFAMQWIATSLCQQAGVFAIVVNAARQGGDRAMAKRKPEPAHFAQMDMFGGWTTEKTEPTLSVNLPPPEQEPVEAANDQVANSDPAANDGLIAEVELKDETPTKEPAVSLTPTIVPVTLSNGWENDEWWTTAMVCAYLKLGRKAIWERIRNPRISFPQPRHFGSARHRWRAGEVKAWADGH
jgi:predicted DNA-binding transcriptional regulator AlpA